MDSLDFFSFLNSHFDTFPDPLELLPLLILNITLLLFFVNI
jgi:hypothetical protein